MRFDFGKLAVFISHDERPSGFDEPGDMVATLSARGIELLDGWNLAQYSVNREERLYPLLAEEDGADGFYIDAEEDSESNMAQTSNADFFIGAFCALEEMGRNGGAEGQVFLSVDSESLFWVCHDIAHSRHDFSAELAEKTVYAPTYLGPEQESRAHVEGARLALANNVRLAEIVGCVVSAMPAFEQRFGEPCEALDSILRLAEEAIRANERERISAQNPAPASR